MCPPPNSTASDPATGFHEPARGALPPPPDVGPARESPPSGADRTVVTRRPRASHKPSEHHELLPTLRLPPVEARALRRRAQADVSGHEGAREGDDDELLLHSGEIELEPQEPSSSLPDPREGLPTLRVLGSGLTPNSMEPIRARRPPLPLPDVLRHGPRLAPQSLALAKPIAITPRPAVPEAIMMIDTASLVLEVAESLTAAPMTAAPVTAAPIVEPAPAVAPELYDEGPAKRESTAIATNAVFAVAAAPGEAAVLAPRGATSRSPRLAWFAAAVGVAASLAVAGWWLAPTASQAVTGLEPLRDQLTFAATAMAQPEPTFEPPTPDRAAPPAVDTKQTALPEADAAFADAPATMLDPPEPPEALAAIVETTTPAAMPETPTPPAAATAATLIETTPAPAARRVPRSRKHASPHSAEPKLSASPRPAPVAQPPATLDAEALLRQAEKAFADGRHGTALRNAQRSLAARDNPRAARIVALSACKLGREEVARNAIARLPLGQRRGVRNTCKDAGVRV